MNYLDSLNVKCIIINIKKHIFLNMHCPFPENRGVFTTPPNLNLFYMFKVLFPCHDREALEKLKNAF